ncbi:MAG: hypothetical protein PHQ42_03540 [Patescibacteria group bacterium]|nr:hypothetical protein [Patescibacteria group bacterium]
MKLKFLFGLKNFFKKHKNKFNQKNIKIFSIWFLIYISLIFFILQWNSYNIGILKYNFDLIKFLSPLLLLSLAWFIASKHKELVITLCIVIITIVFFWIENNKSELEGVNIIQTTNIYNCRIIDNNINFLTNSENNDHGFVLNFFITEPYYQNLDLIFKKAGKEKSDKILRAIFEMEGANSFIKINIERATNFGNIDLRYNEEIIKWSKKIKPIICKKLFYKDE